MKQITITSADTIVDDTQVGMNVGNLNLIAATRAIDAWPGREQALGILEWGRSITDEEYADLESAPDDTIAAALIRDRFLTELGERLIDVLAVIEDALPPARKAPPRAEEDTE